MTDEWWLEDDDDDADPLTEDEFQELHLDLIVLHDELEERMRAPTDVTEAVELDQPIGRLSPMDAIQQKKMAQAQRLRMRARLSKVVVALKLVVEEEYGECRRCGENIGYPRLKPTPETLLCPACAKSAEKKR
jgi:DnaK suppressor protein